MSAGLEKIKQQFENMSTRERNIVMVALLALLVFLWDQLLFSPLQRSSASLRQQISVTQSKINEASTEMVLALKAVAEDPNQELKQQKQQLEKALQEANQRIDGLTSRLIAPRQMAEVLEQVLRQETQLRLVKVTNIPGRQISANLQQTGSTNASTAQPDEDKVVLYQHGVEMLLEGEYFQTLRYLKALEGLPWQVLWGELEYEVQDYPRASIRLQINTLSTDSGWIGV
jgi:MSHA biogenesis protein MshJ